MLLWTDKRQRRVSFMAQYPPMPLSPIYSIEKHQLVRLALELAATLLPVGEPELEEAWELHRMITAYLKETT